MKTPISKHIELSKPAVPLLLLPEESALIRWNQQLDLAWFQPRSGPDPIFFRLELEFADDPALFHTLIKIPYKKKRLTEIKDFNLPKQLRRLITGTGRIRMSVSACHYRLSSPKAYRVFQKEEIAMTNR